MRKTLLLVNGPMGAGKPAVCRELLELLRPGAYLDGDWCWMTRPFQVTEESRAMVMDSILTPSQTAMAIAAQITVQGDPL